MPASPEASKQEESAAAPSTSTAGTSLAAAKTPTLPLPQSVNALTAFVHATQLAHLRERYAYKLRKFARFADDLEKSNARGRRARRRRKLMGNVEGEEESDDGFSSEDDDEPADEERNGESARAAKRLRLTHDDKHPIDPAHAYKLTYDLSPLGSADTYYYGPHPPPPPRVVQSMLKASRNFPSFDPRGLSRAQLVGVAGKLWDDFSGPPKRPDTAGLSAREQTATQQDYEADVESYENDVIAAFSAHCNKTISEHAGREATSLPPAPAFVGFYQPPPPPAQGPPYWR